MRNLRNSRSWQSQSHTSWNIETEAEWARIALTIYPGDLSRRMDPKSKGLHQSLASRLFCYAALGSISQTDTNHGIMSILLFGTVLFDRNLTTGFRFDPASDRDKNDQEQYCKAAEEDRIKDGEGLTATVGHLYFCDVGEH